MNQREPWTSVPSARLFSRDPASWPSICWSIQVWNRTSVTSVRRPLHGRPTCSCTSEHTQERSHMLALVVEGVSQMSRLLGDIVGPTQGNVRTVAACVEEHLRRRALFTITRRLAKGKGWTQQMAILRSWKISACLIFNLPVNKNPQCDIPAVDYKYMCTKQKSFHNLKRYCQFQSES